MLLLVMLLLLLVFFLFLVEFVQSFYPMVQLDNQFHVEFDVLVVLLYVVDVVQYFPPHNLNLNWLCNYQIVRVYIDNPFIKIKS
jgi:hypothetical protein